MDPSCTPNQEQFAVCDKQLTHLEDPIKNIQDALNTCSWKEATHLIDTNHSSFQSVSKDLFDQNIDLTTNLLFAAIDEDCLNTIDAIINHGCDINQGLSKPHREYPCRPLYHAAQAGKVGIVKRLLEARCDIDALNNTGNTALYQAVFEGHTNVVQLLLESGGNPDISDCYGKTAMHTFPFSAGDLETKMECIQLLIQNGADLSIRCKSNQTPADLAIQFKFSLTLKYLMDNAQLLNIRKIPHCCKILGDRILPEILMSGYPTEGTTTIGALLLQLHTCHDIELHTMEEFLRVCEVDTHPYDFHAEAKKFCRLMLISGINNIPTSKTPLSLQESSRIALRRHFAEECWYQCGHLAAPQGIIDYLQLRDVVDETQFTML